MPHNPLFLCIQAYPWSYSLCVPFPKFSISMLFFQSFLTFLLLELSQGQFVVRWLCLFFLIIAFLLFMFWRCWGLNQGLGLWGNHSTYWTVLLLNFSQHSKAVEAREQLQSRTLFPPCHYQGLNSGCQVWWQGDLHLIFWDQISHGGLGFTDHARLVVERWALGNLFVPASPVLGLWVCATMPGILKWVKGFKLKSLWFNN